MKNALYLILLAVVSAACATAQQQKSFTVTGYNDGEFAIKQPIEQQLDTIASAIQRMGVPEKEISIEIDGYASKSGSDRVNDGVALNRADQVRSFFKRKFPGATITVISKGDEADKRMVVISLSTIPIPDNATRETHAAAHAASVWPYAILALAAAGILFFAIGRSGKRPAQPEAAQQTASMREDPSVPKIPEGSVPVDCTRPDGSSCQAYIYPVGSIWMTLFKTQEAPSGPLFRKDIRKAQYCTRQCVANPDYQSAVDELIAAGKITIHQREPNQREPKEVRHDSVRVA